MATRGQEGRSNEGLKNTIALDMATHQGIEGNISKSVVLGKWAIVLPHTMSNVVTILVVPNTMVKKFTHSSRVKTGECPRQQCLLASELIDGCATMQKPEPKLDLEILFRDL